jgi:hypothetical protein
MPVTAGVGRPVENSGLAEARRRVATPHASAVVILAGITLVGLALRLPSFSDSLFGDEISTNFVVNGFGAGSVIHIVTGEQEGTPPLFFLLAWLAKGFDGVEGLRVISLLAGLATIPLTYLLGDRTVGQPAALVGSVLVALSPFQIFYATEARAYALGTFLCVLAALALLIAIDSGRVRWWVIYGLAVAAAAYTHYTTVFVLAALALWALVARPPARLPVLLSNLGAALLYVPWVPELIDDRHEPAAHQIELVHPTTWHNVGVDLVHWSIGHPFIRIAEVPGHLAVWLTAAAAVVGAIGILVAWAQQGHPPRVPAGGLVFVLVLAAAAPVGAALQDLFGPDVFAPRNIITSAPALALVAGVLVTAAGGVWRVSAAGLLIAGFAIGGVKMLDSNNQRPDYAGVVDYIGQQGASTAPVVDSFAAISPGAQTAMEAATAPKGEAFPERPVLALNFPTLQNRLAVRIKGVDLLQPLPVPTPAEIAAEAVRDAGSGPIFLLAGKTTPEGLRVFPGPVADFLNALPSSYHVVESRSFPGLDFTAVTVYVLRQVGRGAGQGAV